MKLKSFRRQLVDLMLPNASKRYQTQRSTRIYLFSTGEAPIITLPVTLDQLANTRNYRFEFCTVSNTRLICTWSVIFVWLGLVPFCSVAMPAVQVQKPTEKNATPKSDANPKSDATRQGHLIQISLPVTPKVAAQVENTLERLATDSKKVLRAEDLPVVVLEFQTSGGRTGQGSDFESCLKLARLLGREEMNRLLTVAYIPDRRTEFAPIEGEGATAKLTGHAVLVAIAANRIAIAPTASIGAAGIDDDTNDQIVKATYQSIAQRRTLPESVVQAMFDKSKDLHRVKSDDQWSFVTGDRLNDPLIVESKTLATAKEFLMLTGAELKEFGLIQNRTQSKSDLIAQYNLKSAALEVDPTGGAGWRAVNIELPEFINDQTTEWMFRSLQQTVESKTANLIIFTFNSSGGDPDVCLELARTIALLEDDFRTVAFIESTASGPPGLAAMACDQIIMTKSSQLGGMFEPEIPEEQLADLNQLVEAVAKAVDRDPALFHAVINPGLDVNRYRNLQTGQTRLMTTEQHVKMDAQDKWKFVDAVPVKDGFDAKTARRFDLSSQTLANMTELENFYQLEEPPASLAPTVVDQWLTKIAHHLASPFVAPWLLFGAFFFISTEMSQPGTGVPGFLGTLCLVAFFWSQYLDGNAELFEILLFLTGVICILLELFIIPGFGIFGIGGFLMVVCSLVLASQTFIIPKTSDEFNQLPGSLMVLVGALSGVVVAVLALRTVLPNMPYFRKMMLEPPTTEKTGLAEDEDPESIVNLSHLVDRVGDSITNLAPAGKAMIDGRLLDVISDGRMIDKGTKVKVVEVTGNRVVVQPLKNE